MSKSIRRELLLTEGGVPLDIFPLLKKLTRHTLREPQPFIKNFTMLAEKKKRGLAALALTDPDRARAIQSKGGKASQSRPWTDPERARQAGIKGNQSQGNKVVDVPDTLSNKDT